MTEKETAYLLASHGVPKTKIALRVGRDRRTIERWLKKMKPGADERYPANDSNLSEKVGATATDSSLPELPDQPEDRAQTA